jgi:transposase-like protein
MVTVTLKDRQKQVDHLIEELGGTCEVARMFDVVPSAVSNWRRAGQFPARTYVPLATQLKVAPPAYLWGMAKAKKTCARDSNRK